MLYNYNPNFKQVSRYLRSRQTDAEKLLWNKLRKKQILGYQFLRQKPIGDYIVDFYCDKAWIVIEIDGGQHYEEKNIKLDLERDEYFKNLGLRVLRFTNLDVLKNIENVVIKIQEIIKSTPALL